MKSTISAEELARIAGVRVTTVRRTAKELFDLLKQDSEIKGLTEDTEYLVGEDPH